MFLTQTMNLKLKDYFSHLNSFLKTHKFVERKRIIRFEREICLLINAYENQPLGVPKALMFHKFYDTPVVIKSVPRAISA